MAGSDSGGGAGIQADLKTFFALGVYGLTAVTAVTAQDTRGVRVVHAVPAEVVAAQIEAAVGDIGAGAAKTGMLWSADAVRAVASAVERLGIPNLVVDPVMAAGTGAPLLEAGALEAMVARLFPLATVVTPNVPEAEALSGVAIAGEADMAEAARRLAALGPRWVIIKGGHLPGGGEAVDLVFDGVGFHPLRGERLPEAPAGAGAPDRGAAPGAPEAPPAPHGAGCTFAAAVAAGLARGLAVPEAARRAKDYVTAAIRHRLPLGGGRAPVNHWGNRWFAYGRTFT